VDIGELVRTAWAPGVTVVIADMTAVVTWEVAGLSSLLGVHQDLVARKAELRLVVWTADLYAALRAVGLSSELPVYANLDAALRAAGESSPSGL
jgi:anti-anti-sigma regulatory factor